MRAALPGRRLRFYPHSILSLSIDARRRGDPDQARALAHRGRGSATARIISAWLWPKSGQKPAVTCRSSASCLKSLTTIAETQHSEAACERGPRRCAPASIGAHAPRPHREIASVLQSRGPEGQRDEGVDEKSVLRSRGRKVCSTTGEAIANDWMQPFPPTPRNPAPRLDCAAAPSIRWPDRIDSTDVPGLGGSCRIG